MILTGEHLSTRRETCPGAPQSTTNITWTGLELNQAPAVKVWSLTACGITQANIILTYNAVQYVNQHLAFTGHQYFIRVTYVLQHRKVNIKGMIVITCFAFL